MRHELAHALRRRRQWIRAPFDKRQPGALGHLQKSRVARDEIGGLDRFAGKRPGHLDLDSARSGQGARERVERAFAAIGDRDGDHAA
jgi:hypothetical protein